MLVSSSQASPLIRAVEQSGEAGERERLRAGLASRVLSGPGLWTGWLDELDRRGLVEGLLADGVIDEAIASAPHDHQLDRALNAKMTVICLIVGCLFPGGGYDSVLAAAFGLPGLPVKPGTPVPTGPALSKARALLGEHVMRRLFELDAARTDADLGAGALWHGMETTAFDGTTAELFACEVLAEAFGVPEGGTKPKLRIVAHVRTGSRRWIGAAVGGCTDGENALADELAGTLKPGMLNLADRGFFSMDRWLRFSGTGAHLCWRVKNGARSVPFKTLEVLPDGSELVRLRESDGMLGKRRRALGDKTAARLPDAIARLVCFTVTTRTFRSRIKTTTIRVLTTLSFTAVLSMVRAGIYGDTCCEHCGRRPKNPLGRLIAGIIDHPRNRTGRTRTSGRTTAERRVRHTEDATYTITITPSNLPRRDESLGS